MISSFWCKSCQKDLDLDAELIQTSLAKFLRTRCPKCDKWLIRYRDNVSKDPYFYESRKMKQQRAELAKDLIQPGQYGFQTIYRKQWLEMQSAMEEAERKEKVKKAERDAFYKKMWYNINDRQIVKAAINAEEKLDARR